MVNIIVDIRKKDLNNKFNSLLTYLNGGKLYGMKEFPKDSFSSFIVNDWLEKNITLPFESQKDKWEKIKLEFKQFIKKQPLTHET